MAIKHLYKTGKKKGPVEKNQTAGPKGVKTYLSAINPKDIYHIYILIIIY